MVDRDEGKPDTVRDEWPDEWVLEWLDDRFPPGEDYCWLVYRLGNLNGIHHAQKRRWIIHRKPCLGCGPSKDDVYWYRITRRGQAALNAYRIKQGAPGQPDIDPHLL